MRGEYSTPEGRNSCKLYYIILSSYLERTSLSSNKKSVISFTEITGFYCENCRELINTSYWESANILSVKVGDWIP
jgi:hypothetical protein